MPRDATAKKKKKKKDESGEHEGLRKLVQERLLTECFQYSAGTSMLFIDMYWYDMIL